MALRLWGAGLLALAMFTGCGGDSETVPVSGTVTYEGEPLPEGDIVFRPADGPGAAHAGKIENGSFRFDSSPGKKQVEITARREVAGADNQFAESGEEGPVLEQYIPPQYNDDTTLEADVSESGGNTFEFELEE